MEEKLLKLMAQLGLIAVVIWVIAGAFGKRDEARIYAPPAPAPPYPDRTKGDVWQRGCVAEPYAQPTFQQELVLGAA
jgi:hypothetical protein